jgi:hypothetical protein
MHDVTNNATRKEKIMSADYNERLNLARQNLRDRVKGLSEDSLCGVVGSRICTQVANDYDVDDDELHTLLMMDIDEAE